MAPEQIRSERIDERTDVYALGVLLFQLVTGHYPFNAEDFRQISLLHLHQPAPRPSALARVSPAIDGVVLRAMEKVPDRRFPSARDFLAALRAAADEHAGVQVDETVQAVGVYFEVFTAEDESDDAAFEDMANVLDTVEQILISRAFVFPLRTSNALLAVQRIPDDGDMERARSEADDLVTELQSILQLRPDPHPGVQTAFSLTVGEVLCKRMTEKFSVVGGPLLKVSNWTTHHRVRDEE
jgi:serine/threonine-protein kinase